MRPFNLLVDKFQLTRRVKPTMSYFMSCSDKPDHPPVFILILLYTDFQVCLEESLCKSIKVISEKEPIFDYVTSVAPPFILLTFSLQALLRV